MSSEETLRLRPMRSIAGTIRVPGDKSISHRAVMLAAAAEGRCVIDNLAPGADLSATVACMRALGAEIEREGERLVVTGSGGLQAPASTLRCENSGTTMRLLAGLLAGAGIPAVLDGDASLRKRPMRRVLAPLREMGARGSGTPRGGDEGAPLTFEENADGLRGMAHTLPVASAQVKSALLLAGIFAEGETWVHEPQRSRDHTERMLPAFGIPVTTHEDGSVSVRGGGRLRSPGALRVPGDPSSAAFLVALATLLPDSDLRLEGIASNPTRMGWLAVLRRMGAEIRGVEHAKAQAGEPVCDLEVRSTARLEATEIAAEEIPSLVDEIPILAVVATQAHGTTRIRGAGELRVKESDRLAEMARQLGAMGARIEELPDGLQIEGPTRLSGARLGAAEDHRIAMSLAVAASIAEGPSELHGAQWAEVSYPGFYDLLR